MRTKAETGPRVLVHAKEHNARAHLRGDCTHTLINVKKYFTKKYLKNEYTLYIFRIYKGDITMWMYKICQGTKKQYTVVDRCCDKRSAEILKRNFEFFNHKNTFIKRYSEEEGI